MESKIGNEYMRNSANEAVLDMSITICFAP